MRRALVFPCSFLMVSIGLMPAAQADQVVLVTTAEEEYFPGTPAFTSRSGCAGHGGPFNNFLWRVEANDPPPPPGLGTRSWGFTPQNGATGNFFGVGVDLNAPGTTSAALDTFSMQVYGAAASSGRAAIFTTPPGTIPGGHYLGMATVSGGGNAWTTVNAANLTYTWAEYDADNIPTGFSGGTKTLDAFVTDKGESINGYLAALGFGCDGQTFWYDGFKWGASGNVTTLDFEAWSTSITISATKATIVAGKSTTINGSPSVQYFGGTPADLEVKKFGESSFSKVATVLSSTDPWTLSKTVKPMKQATYRWHFLAENNEFDAESFSPEQVINVKTGLTATLADNTLNRGQNLVVTGKTKPSKPGMTVTLWRKTSTGSSLLATTTVKPDGTYKMVHTVSQRGTWKVYTTIPASPGNLAGKSPIREAQVS